MDPDNLVYIDDQSQQVPGLSGEGILNESVCIQTCLSYETCAAVIYFPKLTLCVYYLTSNLARGNNTDPSSSFIKNCSVIPCEYNIYYGGLFSEHSLQNLVIIEIIVLQVLILYKIIHILTSYKIIGFLIVYKIKHVLILYNTVHASNIILKYI